MKLQFETLNWRSFTYSWKILGPFCFTNWPKPKPSKCHYTKTVASSWDLVLISSHLLELDWPSAGDTKSVQCLGMRLLQILSVSIKFKFNFNFPICSLQNGWLRHKLLPTNVQHLWYFLDYVYSQQSCYRLTLLVHFCVKGKQFP